jgi:glycosyltransferase involved in cell wall biosynthesis
MHGQQKSNKEFLTMRIIVIGQKNIEQHENYAETVWLLLKTKSKENTVEIIEPGNANSIDIKQLPENFLLHIDNENKSQLSLRWFYDVQLLSITKKIKATHVIDLNGCCSNTLKVPQVLILNDISYLEKNKKDISVIEKYSRKNAVTFFTKASSVITYSDFSKNFIAENFKCDKEKIKVVEPVAADFYKPVSFETRETVKEKFTESKEFFISVCNEEENNFIDLLKAFSVFKKWQKSNMKLLMLCLSSNNKNFFQKNLAAYKYRNDVCLTDAGNKKESAEMIASAYALLHHSHKDGDVLNSVNALQCGIPVISSTKKSMKDICGEAALYAEDDEPKTFGHLLISLYKDEKLRDKMTLLAGKQSEKFDVEKNSDTLWKIISNL